MTTDLHEHDLTATYGPVNVVYPVRTPFILTMHTIVALADASFFFYSPVHGYVVCINFLVIEMLSNVYTSTHRLRASPIFIPNMYHQQHLSVGIAVY